MVATCICEGEQEQLAYAVADVLYDDLMMDCLHLFGRPKRLSPSVSPPWFHHTKTGCGTSTRLCR